MKDGYVKAFNYKLAVYVCYSTACPEETDDLWQFLWPQETQNTTVVLACGSDALGKEPLHEIESFYCTC